MNCCSVIRSMFIVGIICIASGLHAQQIDIEEIGKTFSEKPLRVGGGIAANAVFYDGNDGQNRQPFTYFLSGNINFNLFNQINVPFSFNLTNLGVGYGYPTLPNRFSIHPTYKWIAGHIGDVAMSFSPYTLNGHMFTGVGVDLTPEGPWKFSAMYGRLQRGVEYDTANRIIPAAYQRMGYATKIRYDQDGYYLGMTTFTAKDNTSSLDWKPDSLNIFPHGNTAFSWEAGITIMDKLTFSGEYGLSLFTRDIRTQREGSSLVEKLTANRASTHVYKAMKAEINYQLKKNTLGIGYERIDPEYRTLGAYYFNNDLENITLRYARPFYKDKLNLMVTWGIQRDDLNRDKEQSSKRMVSSANLNYTPNEKFNASLSYSGFQTHMNIRSQFDYINNQSPYDNLDTLDFTQLSQNLSVSSLYNFGKNENRRHSLTANMSYQQAADRQGEVIKTGSLSQLYNFNTSYGLLFVPEALQINAAFNTTFNHIGGEAFLIMGPTLGIRSRILRKLITMGLSGSYNVSYTRGDAQSSVTSVRWNAGYTLAKKHTFGANTVWQNRSILAVRSTHSLIATISYSMIF